MTTRYQEFADTATARAKERALWSQYYQRECSRRGLRIGVDSLDRFSGRVMPLGQAATQSVGNTGTVAGVPLLRVPGADNECSGLSETGTLVDRASLSQPVRDALDAEDADVPSGARQR